MRTVRSDAAAQTGACRPSLFFHGHHLAYSYTHIHFIFIQKVKQNRNKKKEMIIIKKKDTAHTHQYIHTYIVCVCVCVCVYRPSHTQVTYLTNSPGGYTRDDVFLLTHG
jgi:hypothetical protein